MARRPEPQPLPLLAWHERAAVERLEAERDALRRRIAVLPRFSHRRIELEMRLKLLTAEQLRREQDLRGLH